MSYILIRSLTGRKRMIKKRYYYSTDIKRNSVPSKGIYLSKFLSCQLRAQTPSGIPLGDVFQQICFSSTSYFSDQELRGAARRWFHKQWCLQNSF